MAEERIGREETDIRIFSRFARARTRARVYVYVCVALSVGERAQIRAGVTSKRP